MRSARPGIPLARPRSAFGLHSKLNASNIPTVSNVRPRRRTTRWLREMVPPPSVTIRWYTRKKDLETVGVDEVDLGHVEIDFAGRVGEEAVEFVFQRFRRL